jgi:hypothetical protein
MHQKVLIGKNKLSNQCFWYQAHQYTCFFQPCPPILLSMPLSLIISPINTLLVFIVLEYYSMALQGTITREETGTGRTLLNWTQNSGYYDFFYRV